ncbi:MAG: hypothetical protein JXR94_20025 [Candidatus Hydrogenedentes bacterium]|nr:hypothetical protein [Candidatus Hydrogenedentota bacterium]
MKRHTTFLIAAIGSMLIAVSASADGYLTAVGAGDDEIPVVVVSGTPHEMGFAFGRLMKDQVEGMLIPFLAAAKIADEERYGDANLDAAWKAVSPYIHERFIEELRGLGEGSGVGFDNVRRAHMIPVVSDYSCSGAALWGPATRNGTFYQFRNLDYTMNGGLQNFPAVVVYLPEDGIPHVNVTFAGYIGVNTGMNAKGITLTEMGDSPGREYPYDLDGAHFTTLFRDLLYDADDLDEAVEMIKSAKRIKKYHYIIGDGASGRAVKMLAHAPDLVIWKDNDATDEVAPNVKEGVVYNCEGRDPIGWAHLSKYYGRYDASAVIQLSAAVGGLGGNLLNVVYDGTNLELWVSYAHKRECAYQRAYVHIKMKDYLDMANPPEGAVVLPSN